jgi:hypothetical protein
MRSILFWGITQRIVVITYRRFGKICQSHIPLHKPRASVLQVFFLDFWTLENGVEWLSRKSVRNYHYTLRYVPEQRSSRYKIYLYLLSLYYTDQHTKCYGNETSYTLLISGRWIRKWQRKFQLSFSFRVTVKFHFFFNYILGLRLQKLATFYAGSVILIPRWNHLIGYRRCRYSSRNQENCCLSTLISSY